MARGIWNRTARSARRLSLAALLGVLALAAWGAYAVFAANPPAAPTITASPAAFTSSTSASFTYKDSGTIQKFQCSLDAGAYADCGTSNPAAKSYTGLSATSHTFSVKAVSSSGTSASTSFSWTIDQSAPTLSAISATGASPTNAASVSWTVTFNEDVNGVGAGNLALTAVGLGGSVPTITSVTPSAGPASTWTVTATTGSTTPSGSGTLQLKLQNASGIKDKAGNNFSGALPASGDTYTIDKTAPVAPTITSGPTPSPAWTTSTNAMFSFTGESGASFLCKLDGGSFASCTSSKPYGGLAQGSHAFQVEQVDQAGNVSPAASRAWQVDTVPPAAPTLTGKPNDPTNQTTGTFTFSGEASATFLCKHDGDASFTACSSGIAYTGLGVGSHTFQVEAKDPAGNIGAATTYTWTIDQTPPSISVSFPINGGVYNANGWNSGCSGGAGICGSATDPQGVAAGLVSIQQQSSGRWWNGSAFNSNTEVFNNATQTGGAGSTYTGRYSLALPPDGLYTVHVRATDKAGNTTAPGSQVSLGFRIKTTKPPAPVFDQTPPNPSSTSTSTFKWHDAEAGVTYLCSTENGAFTTTVHGASGPDQPCSSPLTYIVQTTNNGLHQFAVEAVDAAGNVSSVASYSWKVSSGSPQQFKVDANVTGLLYPGVSRPMVVTIHNPSSSPIFVTSLTLSVHGADFPAGCNSSDFHITQATFPATGAQVPANGQLTLPGGGATAPSILMANNGAQNACQNVVFHFDFTGQATT